jgi:hypothetical protein
MLTFFFFPAHSKILDTLGWHPSDFKLRSAHSEMATLLLQGLSTVYQIKMIGYPVTQGLSTVYKNQNDWYIVTQGLSIVYKIIMIGSKVNHKPRTLIQIGPSPVHTFSFKPEQRTYQTEPL